MTVCASMDRFHRELTGAIERRDRDTNIEKKIKSYTGRRKTTKPSDSPQPSQLIEIESETDDEIATLFS